MDITDNNIDLLIEQYDPTLDTPISYVEKKDTENYDETTNMSKLLIPNMCLIILVANTLSGINYNIDYNTKSHLVMDLILASNIFMIVQHYCSLKF